MTLDQKLAELAVCDLETVGRISGRAHVVELWFAVDAERDRIFMMSGGRDNADWVRNIRRNPRVRVRLGGHWLSGVAAEIEGDANDELVRQLLAAKYQGWSPGRRLSGWARNSLPIEIDLAP